MDIFLHVANTLLLVSFSVRSMLWLRALNMLAGALFIVWAANFPEPLWATIGWNIVFGLVNLYRIWRAILERRPPTLTAEEQALYHQVFSGLDARDFRRLLDLGRWENGIPPQLLAEQGKKPDRIWLVAQGHVAVHRGETCLRSVTAGDFVGETAYLSGLPMAADIRVSESVRFISWSTQDLEAFMERYPGAGSTLQRILGQCVVRKLQAA